MKKIIMFIAAMILSVAAFAQVRVSHGETVTTYEKGATINIDSNEITEVTYGKVLISIPKGKKVVISQNKAGNILISGYDLAGVKIMGREVKADDAAVYVVNPANKTITKTAIATSTKNNNQQNTNKNNQQNRGSQKVAQQNVQQINIAEQAFAEVNEAQYVNNIASQQAVENIEEQLSPSSPR